MKQNHIIIGLLCGILGVFCLTGCDKADGIGDWTFEYPAPIFENTELGQLRKELYETYKVNAERKSKVDDNTAKMQSIKWLGV